MDDLVREVLLTDRQLTIAALQGNAGAGGVFLALAADRVHAARRRHPEPALQERWATSTAPSTGPTSCRAASPRHGARGHRTPPADRRAPGGGPGTDRRPLRRDAGRVPRRDRRAAREALAADPGFAGCSRRSMRAGRPTRRASRSTLSGRGARADEAQLLRLRPQLPRRALQLRATRCRARERRSSSRRTGGAPA